MGIEFGGSSSELSGSRAYELSRVRRNELSWARPGELLDRPGSAETTKVDKPREVPRDIKPKEKPVEIKARTFKLTVGGPDTGGVTVQKLTLDTKPREFVISSARGVQLGDHNRQLNNYKYEVRQARVDIGRLFEGRPDRQRAFDKLALHPNSVLANLDFRMRLSKDELYSGGRVQRVDTSSPQIQRFKASLDENGRPVVTDCRAVQVGDCGSQRNNFTYQLVKPDLSLEAAMKRSPDLARDMAVAANHPDNNAVKRSLTGQIMKVCSREGLSIKEHNLGHSHDGGLSVKGGDGVQGGSHNVRLDRISVDPGKFVLVGWNGLGTPEDQQARDAERDQRLAEGHQAAIAASRSPSSLSAPPDAAGMHARQTGELLNRVVARTATATLREVAPNREHLTKRMADEMKNALDSPWWSSATEPGPEISVGREHAKSRFGEGMNPSEASAQIPGFSRNGNPGPIRKQPSGDRPYLELVSAAAVESRPDREESVPPQVPSAHTTASVAKDFRKEAPATGAVLCGSAEIIAEAMRSRRLNANVLLTYVRRRVWESLYDGTCRSAVSAMHAVQALQLISFADPATSSGMWVVIDPARQAAAASACIDMGLSAGLPGRFRVLTHEPKTSPIG
jgi:hypothetical protein